MFALRQIIENPGDFIPVPEAVKHRHTEVIFLIHDPVPIQPSSEAQAPPQDLGIAEFFGCIPDFPEREPQGEYPVREPFH
jgi:hypothetical protein